MGDATHSKTFKGGTLKVDFGSPYSCRVSGEGFTVNGIPHTVSESFSRDSYTDDAGETVHSDSWRYSGAYTRRTDLNTFGSETTRKASSAIHDAARELVAEAWKIKSIRDAANAVYIAEHSKRVQESIERNRARIAKYEKMQEALQNLNGARMCGPFSRGGRSSDEPCALAHGHKGEHLPISFDERYL